MAQAQVQATEEDPKLAMLQEVMAQASRTATEAASASRAAASKGEAISNDMVDAIGELTSAKATISATEEIELAKAENATIAAATASGGVDLQTELLAKMREGGKELQDLLAKKEDITDDKFTGIGLIDSIINGFRSVQLDEVIDSKRQTQLTTLGQVQAITAGTESAAKEATMMMQLRNEDTIAAKSKEIVALGIIEARKAELDSLHSNAQLTNQAFNADMRSIDLLASAYRLETDAEDRALRNAQHAAAVKDLKEKDATKEQLVAAIQRGQSMLHGKEFKVEPAETILYKLESKDAQTSQKYFKYLDVGVSTVTDPLGGILGSSPYEARKTMAIVDTSGTMPDTRGTKILKQVEQQLVANYASVGKPLPKDEAELKAAYDTLATKIMEEQAAEIKSGDRSNPYAAPPMAGVLSETKAVKDSVLWRKVLAPLGLKETDHQVLIDHAVAAASTGVITPEEAIEGINTIFKTAAVLNNTTQGGLRRAGLPVQDTYKVRVDSPSRSFSTIVGDVAEAASIAVPMITFPGVAIPKGLNLPAISKELLIGSIDPVDLMDESRVRFLIVKHLSAMPKGKKSDKNEMGDVK